MPAVALLSPRSEAPAQTGAGGHPKAYLATDTGLRCVIPIAPQDVDHDGYADEWETLEREGRKPVVRRSGEGLRTMSLELFVASQELGRSVETTLAELAAIAASGARVTLSYGRQERGVWRLSSCGIKVTERAPFTNDATKASVALQFLEASDVVVSVGPLTGGHKAPPKTPAARAAGTAADRTHIVKAGETLAAIATRYYGSGASWQALATLNKIMDPRKLKAGTRLRIPSKLPTR